MATDLMMELTSMARSAATRRTNLPPIPTPGFTGRATARNRSKYAQAVKYYDAVLEQFPGNPKAPAAQLRKGESLLASQQRDAGAQELRSLIQRYPQTPEATEARSKLNGMGIRISPKPTAYR